MFGFFKQDALLLAETPELSGKRWHCCFTSWSAATTSDVLEGKEMTWHSFWSRAAFEPAGR